jgi:hypothetical protein
MALDNEKPQILGPAVVLELLRKCDDVDTINRCVPERPELVHVEPAKLRELVTVWLRVASLLEGIEMNPGSHTDEEHCAVSILLTGECKHGKPDTHDTDPHNAKPEPPMLKCTCGYHGPANDDYSCPACGAEFEA